MSKSGDLSIFLVNYGPSFARTAYLLTGDPDRARDLALDSLVAACRRWPSIRSHQPVYAVLRELYGRYLAVTVPPPRPPEAYLLGDLSPKARAAVVACHHDGLNPQQAAAITGMWFGLLDKELREATARLRTRLSPQDAPEPEPRPVREPEPEPVRETPWAAPTQPWDAAAAPPPLDAAASPPPGDPALRAALITVAAELPDTHTNLAGQVLAHLRRRRRVRVATWSTVSLGTVGAFVALIAVGVNAVITNIEQASFRGTISEEPTPRFEEEVPNSHPLYGVDDPIQYATRGYCRGAVENDADSPRPCGQWRLTDATGSEYRLEGARAGFDEETDAVMPLHISQDGFRLAYRHVSGKYTVRDLRTAITHTIAVRDQPTTPHLTSSPNGRYFTVDFGRAEAYTLDFATGDTHTDRGEQLRILAVANDGSRVISDERETGDVPGHASVTTLAVHGEQGKEGGYRIDPALTDYGGALAPDGRTLALLTADWELITMDARTGRITGTRTDLGAYDVIGVERWLTEKEVLVRSWDDDYVMFSRVNVETGKITDISADWTEFLDYESPLGAFEP